MRVVENEAVPDKYLKPFVSVTFIQAVLELFDSEDSRERDCLKGIFHRLYSKLVSRRKMMRKAMNDCLCTLIHENDKFNGAPELLDILSSIISGFAVPLREEHVNFFKKIIIPLHKVPTCQLYHDELFRCSLIFLAKDAALAIPVLKYSF